MEDRWHQKKWVLVEQYWSQIALRDQGRKAKALRMPIVAFEQPVLCRLEMDLLRGDRVLDYGQAVYDFVAKAQELQCPHVLSHASLVVEPFVAWLMQVFDEALGDS